jgi:hypothetical protein
MVCDPWLLVGCSDAVDHASVSRQMGDRRRRRKIRNACVGALADVGIDGRSFRWRVVSVVGRRLRVTAARAADCAHFGVGVNDSLAVP